LHESSLFCPALEGNRSCKTYNVRTKTYNFRTNVSNVHTVSSTIYKLLTLQQIYNIYNHSTFKNPLLIITNPLPVCMYSFIFLLVLRRIQSNLMLFNHLNCQSQRNDVCCCQRLIFVYEIIDHVQV
jgi:hypothetical protein